jgi:hypothetical protein
MKITIETNSEKVVVETDGELLRVHNEQHDGCCPRGHKGVTGPQGIPEDKTSEYGGV